MSWRGMLALVLLVGAVALGWLQLRKGGGEVSTDPADARSDYVLHDFELVTLNAEGVESFSLRAPELQQTPGGRTLQLATPLFLMPDKHGGYWEIRSRTGEVNEDSTQIRLREDVVAISPGTDARQTRVETDALDVFPNDNKAITDAVVTVTSPGTTMRGTGMEADLADADRRIQLLSKVGITYEPRTR